MANLGGTFDATQVDPSTASFPVLPAGPYLAHIAKSEMRDNSKGTGQYLWLEFETIEGEFAGVRLWSQLNLINPSQVAVEIAQRDLSAICHATGQMQVNDSEQLHFKPLTLIVKTIPEGTVRKGKNGAQDYVYSKTVNEIGGYEAPKAAGAAHTTHAAPAAIHPARVASVVSSGARPAPAATGGAPAVARGPWNTPRAGVAA